MEIKIYKIWDTERQLFFKGGWSNTDRDYGKQGKTWNQLNHVKNCLRGHCSEPWLYDAQGKLIRDENGKIKRCFINNIPDSWEIIEFSSVTGEKKFKAKDLYPPTNE